MDQNETAQETERKPHSGLIGAWANGILVGLGLAGLLMWAAYGWDRAHGLLP